MDDSLTPAVSGMHEVGDCLIVAVAGGLDEDGLTRLKREILAQLETSRARGVLINVSAVPILSAYGFSILLETVRAVGMMGAPAVLVGIRPGVAAALVELDIDLSGILTAVTTEDAFELIRPADAPDEDDTLNQSETDDTDSGDTDPANTGENDDGPL
ncbi:MAG TPA: hypothetical protein DHV36_01930 [Desulfobacteraceae bacterium]|nr:hypothetical protein [Desulfobacteraceae bacterium]